MTVQNGARGGNVEGVFGVHAPRDVEHLLDVCAADVVLGRARLHRAHATQLAADRLFGLLGHVGVDDLAHVFVELGVAGLAELFFDGAQPPSNNHSPVAGQDDLHTNVNTPLTMTDATLLSNDGDLDGDTLVVMSVDAADASGSLEDGAGGSYIYTPLPDFIGTDLLTYAVSDGNGGTDSGLVRVLVAHPTTVYYPESVTIITGAYDWGTMASFVMLALGGRRPQTEGALKYVTLNLLSSAIFLAGVGVLYGMTGTLNMGHLAEIVPRVGREHRRDTHLLNTQ